MNWRCRMSRSLFSHSSHQPRPAGSRVSRLTRLLLVAGLFCSALNVSAQTDFLRLKFFGNTAASAATPWCVPIEGSDGVLYGTTSEGGTNDFGTVFKVNKDGSGLTILHRFAGSLSDGQSPQGGVIEGNDGALYGTTFLGGSNLLGPNYLGTVFRLTKDGATFSILRHLSSADGIFPQGSLVQGSDGALYGTTAATVFKVNANGGGFTVLHGFGATGDGKSPQFGIIEASDGALYGTTLSGGSNNLGTVFKLNKDGGNYTLLHSFDGTNGRGPQAGLLEASNGMLYGTTSYRAANSYGTVFQLDKAGSNFPVLHTFWGTNSEGWYPQSGSVEGNDGALYGTTTNGGLERSEEHTSELQSPCNLVCRL